MTSEAVEFQGVTPNLMYEDLDVAIDWLTSVCGFRERARYVDEDGVARQAELYAGENEIWISGHGEGLWERQARGPEVYIVVWVDDVDAQWRRVRAAGHDAPDPVDRSFGVRNFTSRTLADITGDSTVDWRVAISRRNRWRTAACGRSSARIPERSRALVRRRQLVEDDVWQVHAVRYAHHEREARDNFVFGDDFHDGSDALDFSSGS